MLKTLQQQLIITLYKICYTSLHLAHYSKRPNLRDILERLRIKITQNHFNKIAIIGVHGQMDYCKLKIVLNI